MQLPTVTRSCVRPEIPADLGDKFLSELRALMDTLANQGGFKEQYQRAEMLEKYCDLTTTPPEVRRRAAIEKWLATERRNSRTNARIQLGLATEKDFGWATWEQVRERARELVGRVLGPMVYPAVIQAGIYTNGASTRVKRSPSAALHKLSGIGHLSSAAVPHWLAAFNETRLSSQTVQMWEESDLLTVPKKSSIDRVICKEPECNMLLQRSVGIHIRNRLKVFGIDLTDQTDNQRLAREAVALNLATVDLSSASDSITRQLVLELLPWEWYSLLDDLRVKSVKLDGVSHDLEMFSSMGNGFTFELESLLFWALTRSVCWISGFRGRISVYGDDIICPVASLRRLKNVFGFLGLLMNQEKTHSTGEFRESCGSHWHRGFDVKPFYVRREVRELPDLINHLNHLLEWDGRGWGFFTTEEAYLFWLKWMKVVPRILWGGIDPSDPSALVTGHAPRYRLTLKTRRVARPADAALHLWLLSRDRHHKPQALSFEGIYDDAQEEELGDHLVIDPRVRVGYNARPVVSRGERTSWDPGIAFMRT